MLCFRLWPVVILVLLCFTEPRGQYCLVCCIMLFCHVFFGSVTRPGVAIMWMRIHEFNSSPMIMCQTVGQCNTYLRKTQSGQTADSSEPPAASVWVAGYCGSQTSCSTDSYALCTATHNTTHQLWNTDVVRIQTIIDFVPVIPLW